MLVTIILFGILALNKLVRLRFIVPIPTSIVPINTLIPSRTDVNLASFPPGKETAKLFIDLKTTGSLGPKSS